MASGMNMRVATSGSFSSRESSRFTCVHALEMLHSPVEMCRSIKRLRERDVRVSDREIEEAALQFVRKISGYRKPSVANEPAFVAAVDEIAASSRRLMVTLTSGV